MADPWQGISRSQKALKRMADGSLGGATNLASPVTPSGAALVIPTVVPTAGGSSGNPQVTLLRRTAQTFSTQSDDLEFLAAQATADAADYFVWNTFGIDEVLVDGFYRISAYMQWTYPGNNGLELRMQVTISDTDVDDVWATAIGGTAGPAGLHTSIDCLLEAGTVIGVKGYQYTGGTTFTNDDQRLTIEKLPDATETAI